MKLKEGKNCLFNKWCQVDIHRETEGGGRQGGGAGRKIFTLTSYHTEKENKYKYIIDLNVRYNLELKENMRKSV